jgi:hypothetical protein
MSTTKKYIAFSFAVMLAVSIIQEVTEKDESRDYFNNLNLDLDGIITDKQEVMSDRGLIYLNVTHSSISDYDVRNASEAYYCVIHGGKAEIVEGGLSEIEKNDSIVISAKTKTLTIFRNGKLVESRPLYLSKFKPFTEKLNAIHRL